MRKKIIKTLGILLLFASCSQNEIKQEGNIVEKNPKMLERPQEIELDQDGEGALIFIRSKEKKLGEVTRYRKQKGEEKSIYYYFEFSKPEKPPMEIIVYENSDGDYEINSIGVLE